jgi:hypothetical protein
MESMAELPSRNHGLKNRKKSISGEYLRKPMA